MRVLVVVMAPFEAAVPFGGFTGLIQWSLQHVKRKQPLLFPTSLDTNEIKFEEVKPCLAKDDFEKAKATLPLKDALMKEGFGAIILSGGMSMVSDKEPWSESCAAWLREEAIPSSTPVLGICYGHQLIAHALGGKIDFCPNGKQIGMRKAKWNLQAVTTKMSEEDKMTTQELLRDPVCGPLAKANLKKKEATTKFPLSDDNDDKKHKSNSSSDSDEADPMDEFEQHEFDVLSLHHQSIVELPKGARIFASSPAEPHQVVKFQENVYSVQFHGEYSTDFLKARFDDKFASRMQMADEHVTKSCGVCDTSHGSAIIARFLDYSLGLYQQRNKNQEK